MSQAPAAYAAPAVEFDLLDVDLVDESRANPRRHFDKTAMGELTASIQALGVIEPILVRPQGGRFEVVAGNRRLRAARSAKLPKIPALIRPLTDGEALEVAIIENLQRADVHPLDEAEGYGRLLASKERKFTPEEIAAKVGKSKAYVYGRLRLLDLTAPARKAFAAGKLTASVALLLARVPADLQPKALDAIVGPGYVDDDEPMGYRQAWNFLHRSFMSDLSKAPFDPADAELLPHAGTCAACPKRSGASPDLFGEVAGPDTCTDPNCYGEKTRVDFHRRSEAAKAAGRSVLSQSEAAKVFESQGSYVRYSSSYATLDAPHPSDPKGRTYRKLLGKKAAEAVVLAQAPNGSAVELLSKKELPKLLKAAGHDFRGVAATETGGSYAAEEKKRREAEKAERAPVREKMGLTEMSVKELVELRRRVVEELTTREVALAAQLASLRKAVGGRK